MEKKSTSFFVWPYLTMGIIMIVVISLVIFINQNVQKNNWIWVSSSKSARLRYSRSLVWVSRASWEILCKRCEFMQGLTRGQGQRIKKGRAASSCLQIVLNAFCLFLCAASCLQAVRASRFNRTGAAGFTVFGSFYYITNIMFFCQESILC
jgi:hypothetical protein